MSVDASNWPASIGIVGLGIMGSSIARHLVAAGRKVFGFDTDRGRCDEARSAGAVVVASTAALAAEADVVLTSLPSAPALHATVDAILSAPRRARQMAVELSTLSLADKTREQQRLADAGIALLDCPISGTGAQAATRDIALYVSGDEAAYLAVRHVLAEFSREAVYLGAFGNGTRMKFVANLLVAIHNVAAAEAIQLGVRAGLDPTRLVQVLAAGAGNSRMLQVRGPMMVRNEFQPATMKLDVWQKDMRLIGQFASEVGVATPLFSATVPLYEEAVERGLANQDTAAVYVILEKMLPVTAG